MATNFSLNEYLTIDTTGSVGIGTNVPLSRLYVTGSSSSTTPTVVIREGASTAFGTPIFEIQNSSGTSLLYVTGNIATVGGRVGIGTTQPSAKLHVSSSYGGSSHGIAIGQPSVFSIATNTYTSLQHTFFAGDGTTQRLVLDSNGNALLGGTLGLVANPARFYLTGSSTSTSPTALIRAGVPSPTGALLDIQNSDGTSLFVVSGSGNVGIGTSGWRNLDSQLSVYTESANGTNGLRVFGGAVTSNVRIRPAMTAGANNPIVQEGDNGIIFDGGSKDTGNFVIAPWATGISGFRMTAAGDVGIGISTPSAKLDVNGTVLATSLSGSLTRLSDGTSYLVAGSGVSLVTSSNGSVTISSTASGGGDSAASYLVLSATGSLTSERVFTSGTGITTTDGGAGGNYTIGINDSVVATVSGTTFTGVTKHSAGLSGSLTNLTDGTSYLIGGSNISVTTGSNGSVSLATTGLAPLASPYLIVGSDATLTNERSIAAGTGLSSTDAGAGGNYTLSINNSVVATVSGTTFTGATKHSAGLSGSLTNLTDGTSYLVAGSNVTITTGSNGAVTIASSSPPGTVTGTGTTNYLSKFTGTSTVGNSALTESSSVVNITSTGNNAELRLNNSFSRVAFIDGGGGWAGGYNIKGDASPFSSIQHDSTGNAAGVWYSSLGIQFYANASQEGGSSPAEVMRIASAGKVGIGTTGSSTARLQVQGTSTGTDTTLLVKHNVADGSNLPVLDVQNSAGTSLLFISGSGGVGISTNNPQGAQFYVSSSLTGNPASALIIGGQVSGVSLNTYKGQTQIFQLANGTTEVMRLNSAANVGIGTGTYTARLFVSGSSTATTPTMVVKEGVVSPTGGAGTFDVQNSAGTSLLFVSGSGFVGLGTSATNSTDGLTSYEVLLADTKFLSLRESLANKSIGIRFAANGGGSASSWTTNTSTGEVKLFSTTNFFWTLYTNNSEKLRIDTSGNVGIGTTLLDSKLVVNGNSVFSGSANPDADNTRSLGSSTKRWSNIYATSVSGSLTGSNVSAGQVVVAGTGGVLSGSNSFWWDNTNTRVGIGTSSPGYTLEVAGTFAATTKSFVIPHPTREGWKLRYGSLEGPENGVYARGKSTSTTIDLPEYWTALVDAGSITVHITPIGKWQSLFVEKVENNQVKIGMGMSMRLLGIKPEFFYVVTAARKDATFDVEFAQEGVS